MRRRIVLAVMSLAVVLIFTALHIQAEGPGETPAPQTEVKSKDKLTLDELILAQRFNEFQQMMLRLKHRLERSPKKEDRDRAVILQRVLDQAKNSSLNIRFEQMVDFLKKGDFGNLENVKKARDESLSLAEEMRRLLAMLREDPNANRLREKRTELEKLVKEIQRLIRDQKVVQGQTQEGQMDPKDIKSSQKDVTQRTDQVAKSLGDKASGQGSGKDGELPKSEGGNTYP